MNPVSSVQVGLVVASITSPIVGYTLLQYEPDNRDLWWFISALLLFVAISLIISDALFGLVFDGLQSIDSIKTIGGLIWWLSTLGFVILMAKRLSS